MKNYLLLLIFVTSLLFFEQGQTTQNFLHFSQTTSKRELIYDVTSYGSVIVDAYGSNQILVRNIGGQPDWKKIPSIIFHCKIDKLSSDFEIQTAQLCYKSTLESAEMCHDVRHINAFDLNSKLSIIINTDLMSGFTANFMIKNNMVSIDGFYFCKLSNKINSLSSNFIEIQDVDYDMKRYIELFKPIQNSQQINVEKNERVLLNCGTAPKDYRTYDSFLTGKLQVSPFSWHFCPKKSCDEKEINDLLPLNNMFEYVQHQNGTLDILKIKTDTLVVNLICLEKLYPKAVYSNYLLEVNDLNVIASYNNNIKAISPKITKIVLREGKSTKINGILNAVYYSNPLTTTVTWMKDQTPVNKLFSNVDWTNYNLMFPDIIKKEFSGQYSLVIEQSQPTDRYEFIFEVQVINVPSFEINQTPIIYKIIGQSLNLRREISGEISEMMIEIDNKKVISTAESSNNRNKSLISNFILNNENNRAEIMLEIKNITRNSTYLSKDIDNRKYPNNKDKFSSSHTNTITFIARNSHVVSRSDSILKVLDFPDVSEFIPACNCQEPESLVRSYLKNIHVYESEDLEVVHIWTINGEDALKSEYNIYTIIKNETAILRNTTNINGLELSYRMQIFKKRLTENDKFMLFDSSDYPQLMNSFQTRCVCLVETQLTLVIIVIIVAVSVVILFLFALFMFLTKNKGKTYDIDKNERALGHDPEAECRENETFLNYERQNYHIAIRGSQLSLTHDSVGVGSEGGELDDGIDTTSYSEEGSFIGQYSTTKSSNKNSRDSML